MSAAGYVLITPARNEEEYIEKTIQSVISQTVLPEKWIIVSDGSTDRTDEIAGTYADKYSFIELVTASSDHKRNFGSKVKAFNAGYAHLGQTHYSFIGNLDADVSFDPGYYESILKEFDRNPRLGLTGGIIQELINGEYVSQNISRNSCAGAIQLFRRECFEKIGGYIELPYGGIDAAAEIMVRMHGWEVETLPAYKVLHHRRVATTSEHICRARFRQGIMFHLLGYHPFFQFMRCLNQVLQKPYIIGSICMFFGFWWSHVRRYPRTVPDDMIRFLRKEQMQRLVGLLSGEDQYRLKKK